MMNVANVRAELEDELTRRLDDLRFYRNIRDSLEAVEEREKFCGCLIVMLYAQFEGYWKAAFSIYIKAINQEGIRCKDAADVIVAASMTKVFSALSDVNKKCDFFRSAAPDDSQLHRLHRHAEFARRIGDVYSELVDVPVDTVVNTESNLTPVVVRKNLFRLGFSHKEFGHQEGAIKWLIERRNDIAHGSARVGITEKEYEQIESAITDVMKSVVTLIFDALRGGRYLKQASQVVESP